VSGEPAVRCAGQPRNALISAGLLSSPLPSPVMAATDSRLGWLGLGVSDRLELWQLAICFGSLFKIGGFEESRNREVLESTPIRRCHVP
jgi:hypothetical protein